MGWERWATWAGLAGRGPSLGMLLWSQLLAALPLAVRACSLDTEVSSQALGGGAVVCLLFWLRPLGSTLSFSAVGSCVELCSSWITQRTLPGIGLLSALQGPFQRGGCSLMRLPSLENAFDSPGAPAGLQGPMQWVWVGGT